MLAHSLRTSVTISPLRGARDFAICLLCVLGVGITACSTAVRRPIATSLQALQLDSAPIKGPVLTHHEVFSIAGLLPMPEVGVFYHYPSYQRFPYWRRSMPPSTALGVSDHLTYRLTGTVAPALSEADFNAARSAVIDARRKAHIVVVLEVRRAGLEARLEVASADAIKKIEQALKTDESKKSVRDKSEAIAAAVSMDSTVADLKAKLSALNAEITTAENDLKEANTTLATTTAKPGIVVAEWAIGESIEGDLALSPVLELGGSRQSRRSGLVILGGLRISHLYPGDDLKDIFLNLQAEDRAAISAAGLTTFLLQARYVNYLSDFNLNESLKGYLELEAKDFARPELIVKRLDRVRVAAAMAAAAAMASSGSVSGIDWQVDRVEIGSDLCSIQINSADDWHTVQAVVTTGDRLFKNWFKHMPPGSAVRLDLLDAMLGGDTNALSSLISLNDPLASLRATLLVDRSYWAKQEVRSHLEALSQAVANVNATLAKGQLVTADKADLDAAKHATEQVVTALEANNEITWTRIAARSTAMMNIIRHLHDATLALRRVDARHRALEADAAKAAKEQARRR